MLSTKLKGFQTRGREGRVLNLDKEASPAVCRYYQVSGSCRLGVKCPALHGTGPQTVTTTTVKANVETQASTHHSHPATTSWFAQRPWVCRREDEPDGKELQGELVVPVSVMTFNTLADTYAHYHAAKLYKDVPRYCLSWHYRRQLLLQEINYWAPDVACLQEVEHYADLEAELQQAGYEGTFLQRAGRRRDGCATFWRKDKFKRVDRMPLKFSDFKLDDNVALLVVLQPLASSLQHPPTSCTLPQFSPQQQVQAQPGSAVGLAVPPGEATLPSSSTSSSSSAAGPSAEEADAAAPGLPPLVVANTHVCFDPAKGDVKLGQIRTLFNSAAELAAKWGGLVVVGGDFNTAPSSPLYSFMTGGALDVTKHCKKKLSGQVKGYGYPQYFKSNKPPHSHAASTSSHHSSSSHTQGPPHSPMARELSVVREESVPAEALEQAGLAAAAPGAAVLGQGAAGGAAGLSMGAMPAPIRTISSQIGGDEGGLLGTSAPVSSHMGRPLGILGHGPHTPPPPRSSHQSHSHHQVGAYMDRVHAMPGAGRRQNRQSRGRISLDGYLHRPSAVPTSATQANKGGGQGSEEGAWDAATELALRVLVPEELAHAGSNGNGPAGNSEGSSFGNQAMEALNAAALPIMFDRVSAPSGLGYAASRVPGSGGGAGDDAAGAGSATSMAEDMVNLIKAAKAQLDAWLGPAANNGWGKRQLRAALGEQAAAGVRLRRLGSLQKAAAGAAAGTGAPGGPPSDTAPDSPGPGLNITISQPHTALGASPQQPGATDATATASVPSSRGASPPPPSVAARHSASALPVIPAGSIAPLSSTHAPKSPSFSASSSQAQAVPNDLALALNSMGSMHEEWWDDGAVAEHVLPIVSSYKDVTGTEPRFSSVHHEYLGCCDYLWFTRNPLASSDSGISSQGQGQQDVGTAAAGPSAGEQQQGAAGVSMHCVAVLGPPDLTALPTGLPAHNWGSDHIPLVADYEIRVRRREV